MEIKQVEPVSKEVKPINFLFHRAETTVAQLADFLPVAKDLQREAVVNNLRIVGPVHWHYFGFTGDESKPFTLEVAFPVDGVPTDYDGSFHFKRTEPFRCMSLLHEGPWEELPRTYGLLMQHIATQNLVPTAANREIYLNADFEHPEANMTEVQIGIR
jgi:effector-binding domain-containing protein